MNVDCPRCTGSCSVDPTGGMVDCPSCGAQFEIRTTGDATQGRGIGCLAHEWRRFSAKCKEAVRAYPLLTALIVGAVAVHASSPQRAVGLAAIGIVYAILIRTAD